MNWKIFNRDVSSLPYKPDTPCLFGLDDMAAAAVISGGTSLLGNIFNSSAQRSANKTNREIAQETNAANLALYREQYKNSVEQWNRENAYNDPSSQMARLRAAGLNPSLMMGNNPTGVAGAASLPSANPMVTGESMQAPMVNFSDIGANIAAITQGFKNTAEAQGQQFSPE